METYNKLNAGISAGYGNDFTIVHGDSLPNPRIASMKQNLYKFSAAKNTAMLVDMNERMYDGNRLKGFEEFKKELESLNITYNQNWLEAEYRTARQSGYMAEKWHSIENNSTLFPNLKYKTQGDNKVRPEHSKLDGIIAPINSPFWDKYYPPNGWRCRCDVIQTAEPASIALPTHVPDVKPEFELNIGKSGQIFSENKKAGHTFFALTKNIPGWEKRFEQSKQEAPFEKIHSPKGKIVKVNIYADQRPDEFTNNLELATKMTDEFGLQIEMPAHLDGRILKGIKNPEYIINGEMKADRKTPEAKNYSNILSKANKQSCQIVFISLKKNNDTLESAYKAVDNILKFDNVHINIHTVYIIAADGIEVKVYNRKKATK